MKLQARKIAFTTAIAASLGFGAVQALGQPSPPREAAQVCSDQTCARLCSALGFRGGFCNSGGGCSCYL